VHFHVPYEWRRLALFAAIYVGTATLFLWNRSWSLLAELGLSVLATVTLIGLVLVLLSPAERAQARAEVARRLGRGAGSGAESAP
jgi:hypothetical protein